ncbi:MAG: methyltransferase domain-containing protein [Bacteroidales bacterium]|nr:methyltransferase domain-containing protein [Bacteroidales bacterium]
MIKDFKALINNILAFYDFNNKTIISVGAGGGQLIEYGRNSKKVIAIDNDEFALKQLNINLKKSQLEYKFQLVHSDFENYTEQADVVLFEFCLHEMQNPELAIKHAQSLASNIIIADHSINSEWAYIADETEKVSKSWKSANLFPICKSQEFIALQIFKDYDELYQKVKIQGINSIKRIEHYKSKENIVIPMIYKLALLD